MKPKYILALDQGTTSSRAVLFDEKAAIVGISQKETSQILPQPGWVEQSPEEIWSNQYEVAIKVIKENKLSPKDIQAIGITNQRETTLVWEKKTGKAVYNAIIWQDKRTSDHCIKLKEQGWDKYIHKTTGLVIDSYFSATKLQWILDNVKGARNQAEKGELLFGTVDTFLMWHLSAGKLHITDYSNASRTMLFDIKKCCWDNKLLELFQIPACMLPEVVESSSIYGTTEPSLFEGIPLSLASLIGDQQSALFGQLAYEPGTAKNTYGTGCFLLMNTGERIVRSNKGLISTIAWKLNGKVEYALEGSVFIAGAVMKWLRDNLKLIDNVQQTEAMAIEAGDNQGVYFVPAFAGLGAPYWDSNAKGMISGLTLSAGRNHIVRAALESMAYQTKDILDIMQLDSGINLKELNVDGGASANNFLMQFQSDMLQVKVNRPEMIESTALGTALLAGLAVGLWKKETLTHLKLSDKVFTPSMEKNTAFSYYQNWKNAVERSRM
jgi:glycerol kinase